MDEPEMRRDPVAGRWVVIAPGRAARPLELADAQPRCGPASVVVCPFCEGAERETPNEVYALRAPGSAPNGPGWQLRVGPNLYPAVRQEEPNPPTPFPGREGGAEVSSLAPPSLPGKGVGGLGSSAFSSLFLSAPAYGRAEVLIDCPAHIDDPTQLSDAQMGEVFRAYRERLTALASDTRLAHVAIFKNVGAEAGASIAHTHSQLIALPVVPELIRTELNGAADHFARTGRCVFCELVERELADGARVVAQTANFVAVTAHAPRFAYEMWVLPRGHEARYESITDGAARELAGLVKRVVRALDTVRHAPAYNWFLHTSPLHAGEPAHYHWHLEVMPRTARPAGLEWGHGFHIVTVAPERAASELRAALAG